MLLVRSARKLRSYLEIWRQENTVLLVRMSLLGTDTTGDSNWQKHFNDNLDKLLKAECGTGWLWEIPGCIVLEVVLHFCGYYLQELYQVLRVNIRDGHDEGKSWYFECCSGIKYIFWSITWTIIITKNCILNFNKCPQIYGLA